MRRIDEAFEETVQAVLAKYGETEPPEEGAKMILFDFFAAGVKFRKSATRETVKDALSKICTHGRVTCNYCGERFEKEKAEA